MTRMRLPTAIAIFVLAHSAGAQPIVTKWSSQFGTSEEEIPYGITVSLDGVYAAGYTLGNLAGPNAGGLDAFIRKYDHSGAPLWTRQFGTTDIDFANATAADPFGNVWVTGATGGNLGGTNADSLDVFVRKYDSAGTALWTRQFGVDSNSRDVGQAIATDNLGNAYVTGTLHAPNGQGGGDTFLRKYDAAGNVTWHRDIKTSGVEIGYAVAADALNNVFVGGFTEGNLVGTNAGLADAFIAKYDSAGTLAWTRQFGTATPDSIQSLATDGLGNVYALGNTRSNIGGPTAGGNDVFLRKYDTAGIVLWTRQFGSPGEDTGMGLSVDSLGNVIVGGLTDGTLSGASAGNLDAFIRKYDASGNDLWTTQFGSAGYDQALSIATYGKVIYAAGLTTDDLYSPNFGSTDAFVVAIADIPEPQPIATILIGLCTSLSCTPRRLKKGVRTGCVENLDA
jgi:hypothetical protein